MGERINIAELLKDCPKGMELNCISYDNVSFDKISDDKKATYPIFCYITDEKGNRSSISFTEDGCESKRYGAKCVIFPKGKTTWEGFQRPFKNGDIIYNRLQHKICIYYLCEDTIYINHCRYNELKNIAFEKLDTPIPIAIQDYRLAAEEEKQKLFDAIKANGYKWNAETKTLEKLIVPKFKVGDRVKDKNNREWFVGQVFEKHFNISSVPNAEGYYVPIVEQDEYELVPNKFDINTLKSFDQVLVRLSNSCIWMPKFFYHYDTDSKMKYYPFITIDNIGYPQCIPYNGNEHLCRTTNNCDEFYRVWEE